MRILTSTLMRRSRVFRVSACCGKELRLVEPQAHGMRIGAGVAHAVGPESASACPGWNVPMALTCQPPSVRFEDTVSRLREMLDGPNDGS